MTTFANATETIAHLTALIAKYGSGKLTVWVTADGKFIDLLMLEALVSDGLIKRTGGNGLSAYSSPAYELVNVAEKAA